jgi:methylmalonyl-CoA mutase N-terminal domain/subunit
VRVALRTQQIIAHESKAGDTADALGGSYAIEYLTDEIEKRSQAYLDEIDARGGALAAIETGYIQGEIQDAAYSYLQALEANEEIVVGMNAYQVEEAPTLDRLRVDPAQEAAQRKRLAELRAGRNQTRVSELLTHLESAARGSENLMPIFIECVENQVTLGELCGRLRQLWGEYRPPSTA